MYRSKRQLDRLNLTDVSDYNRVGNPLQHYSEEPTYSQRSNYDQKPLVSLDVHFEVSFFKIYFDWKIFFIFISFFLVFFVSVRCA